MHQQTKTPSIFMGKTEPQQLKCRSETWRSSFLLN